jgi:hypothetical protein
MAPWFLLFIPHQTREGMRSVIVHYILNDPEPWVNDLLMIENRLLPAPVSAIAP